MRKVLVNKVRCKKCDDVIESTRRYDLKRCKCGAIFIDGGTYYQRYGWGINRREETKVEDFIDFSYSVYDDEEFIS